MNHHHHHLHPPRLSTSVLLLPVQQPLSAPSDLASAHLALPHAMSSPLAAPPPRAGHPTPPPPGPARRLPFIRRHPFLAFGGPFLALIVGSSFLMQSITRTRCVCRARGRAREAGNVAGESTIRLGSARDRTDGHLELTRRRARCWSHLSQVRHPQAEAKLREGWLVTFCAVGRDLLTSCCGPARAPGPLPSAPDVAGRAAPDRGPPVRHPRVLLRAWRSALGDALSTPDYCGADPLLAVPFVCAPLSACPRRPWPTPTDTSRLYRPPAGASSPRAPTCSAPRRTRTTGRSSGSSGQRASQSGGRRR